MNETIRIILDFEANIFLFLLIKSFIQNDQPFSINKFDIIFFIYCIIISIPVEIPFLSVIGFIADFIYILLCLNYNVKKSMISFIKIEAISLVLLNIFFMLHSIAFTDYSTIISNTNYLHYKQMVCQALVYISYQLFLNTKLFSKYNRYLSYLFNIVITAIIIITSYIILSLSQVNTSSEIMLPLLVSSFFLFISIFLVLYRYFINTIMEKMELTTELARINIIKEYSSQVESSLKEAHSIRHDMKNNLLIIHKYAQENRTDKISALANDILGQLNSSSIIDTGIPIISAILNTKSAEAKLYNITFSCNTVIPFLSISDNDIIIILGNLLDNAITAAAKCEDGYIKIFLEQQNDLLLLKCENNYSGEIKKKGELFISSKENDGLKHGIGIENVKKAILRLGGTSFFSYDNEVFTVDVTLPNYL